MNALGDIRVLAFPYCIRPVNGGEAYEILNRDYKVLGCPFIFKRKTKEFTPQPDWVYLYNDKTNPTRNNRNMAVYLNKVKRLMRTTIMWSTF